MGVRMWEEPRHERKEGHGKVIQGSARSLSTEMLKRSELRTATGMKPTNQDLPLAIGGAGDLVRRAHFRVRHAPKHEDDEPGATAALGGGLVLMPLPEPRTAGEGERGWSHSPAKL